MLTEKELRALISDIESDRVERTISKNNVDKYCEAICAFSNDLPNHRVPGYFIVGVKDNGEIAGITFSDQDLQNFASHRSNGNILPVPSYTIQKFTLAEGEVVVLAVDPGNTPPVKYKGRIFIRIGPRKGIANEAEERRLSEKRTSLSRSFDASPCIGSKLSDLNLDLFRLNYLPTAVAPEIIEENHRDTKIQLASLGFYDLDKDCPTNGGLLLFSSNPLFFIPGAYVQYVRFEGPDLSAAVNSEKIFSGDLMSVLKSLDEYISLITTEKPVATTALREETIIDYPKTALRELLLNSIMHRDYSSNAPIRFYQFSDHIEIQNPGGLYGTARPENFPKQNDYRNPVIAEVLKNLGYVNKFSRGVVKSMQLLKENQNPEPEFEKDQPTYFGVKVFKRKE